MKILIFKKNLFKYISIILFLLLITLPEIPQPQDGKLLHIAAAKNTKCDIFIINNDNKKILIQVEIADTDESRMKGLMYRKEMKLNNGMLFLFEKAEMLNFWMKNTYLPLSIAYIDETGIINEIFSMAPLDISITYPSKKPAKYALEVNFNWFKNNNITVGNRISFNGCFSK